MDIGFPPPPPAPEMRKHSRLGIASFIISMVVVLIIFGDIALALGLSGGISVPQSYAGVDTALTCASALLAAVGLVLGIVAVTRKNTKKVFGILGLVFNALIVLGICALIGINIMSIAGTS
jgi:hypothetical protein